EKTFTVDSGESAEAKVALFYYPRFKVLVNDVPIEAKPSESGLMSIKVPAEKSEVRIYFEEPKFVVAAFYASGVLWIIILGLLIFYSLRSRQIVETNEID